MKKQQFKTTPTAFLVGPLDKFSNDPWEISSNIVEDGMIIVSLGNEGGFVNIAADEWPHIKAAVDQLFKA